MLLGLIVKRGIAYNLAVRNKKIKKRNIMRNQLVLAAFLALAGNNVDAFSPAALSRRTAIATATVNAAATSPIRMSTESESEKASAKDSSASSFDDAAKAIRDEEDADALARGSGISDEEEAEYQSRSDEFSSMKDRIRERAASMNIEKSVATAEAIKQAELRAKNMAAEPAESELNMSVFEQRMLSDPEDELTDEEMAEIDPVGKLNFFEQALDEVKQTAFPGPLDVAKTVGLMAIVFLVSASIVLKSDEFLRALYIDWGFIPSPDADLSYIEDLQLPKDWDKDLNDLSGVFDAAKSLIGVKVPEAPTLNIDVPSDL